MEKGEIKTNFPKYAGNIISVLLEKGYDVCAKTIPVDGNGYDIIITYERDENK